MCRPVVPPDEIGEQWVRLYAEWLRLIDYVFND